MTRLNECDGPLLAGPYYRKQSFPRKVMPFQLRVRLFAGLLVALSFFSWLSPTAPSVHAQLVSPELMKKAQSRGNIRVIIRLAISATPGEIRVRPSLPKLAPRPGGPPATSLTRASLPDADRRRQVETKACCLSPGYLMNWFFGKFAVAMTPPSTTSG